MSTLNFSRYRPPIMEVELLDKNRTVIHITPPTVDLQEELRASQDDLSALLTGGDEEKRKALFDLAARLMSCNRNWLKITPEQLQKKYNIDVEDLVIFYEQYVEFITRIEHAKN